MNYYFEYQCRLCQLRFTDPLLIAKDKEEAMSHIWRGAHRIDSLSPMNTREYAAQTKFHECPGGGLGMADLLGAGIES